ncbi:hypothetical protein [Bacillus sp. ISL-7]|nr:hypothetical protein [Bacillus sp. ISL-7]
MTGTIHKRMLGNRLRDRTREKNDGMATSYVLCDCKYEEQKKMVT